MQAASARPKVAVVGVGAMGSRIAKRLLERGHRVVAWNRTSSKLDAAASAGVEAAGSPVAAAAAADIVITMVSDPAALAAVTAGADGVARALRPAQTLVEMSTVGPAAVARLRAALAAGVRLVDAPVLGSLAEAERGELLLFVGGTDVDVEHVEPVLKHLGKAVHVGPAGSGAAAKLVANSALFGALAVLGEAVALADRLGLDRETAFHVLAHTPLAAQAERRREAIETSAYPPRFALALARKDAGLIGDAAAAAGADLRVAAAAASWLLDAERAGAGACDYTAVLEHIIRRGVALA